MNPFQKIYDRQKSFFDTDATKTYEWRIDQLTRLENLLKENAQALEEAVARDFKTAIQEKVFEVQAPLGVAGFTKTNLRGWMEPKDAKLPKFLAATGHKAMGTLYGDALSCVFR
jgi:aldehyde dehydrogenase (NAD+)